jgi:hypothetical protein
MCRCGIALLAAGLALAAASARAQPGLVVLSPTATATHVLRSGSTASFGVSCKAGYVATGAGVTRPVFGAALLAISPVGLRAYRFRFANPATNGDGIVSVAVACRKLATPKAYVLRLQRLPRRIARAAPGKTVSTTFQCPNGTTPAGAGFDLGAAVAKQGLRHPSVRRQTSTLGRLTFSVLNAGPQRRTIAFYASCLTVLRVAGAPSERLHVATTSYRVPLHEGNQAFRRSCPRGWFSIAAGFALRARPTQADGAAAVGRSGRWWVLSDAAGGATADLQLACGRLGP